MSQPFLGEIKLVSFAAPPRGWAFCEGQLLPVNTNRQLFELLGTAFGGNGQTTFGLPDLRGRAPLHIGAGFARGQHGGAETHALTEAEMPAHAHKLQASPSDGNSQAPGNKVLARTSNLIYRDPESLTQLAPQATSHGGGSRAHSNMQPYLCLNYMIALVGTYPSIQP